MGVAVTCLCSFHIAQFSPARRQAGQRATIQHSSDQTAWRRYHVGVHSSIAGLLMLHCPGVNAGRIATGADEAFVVRRDDIQSLRGHNIVLHAHDSQTACLDDGDRRCFRNQNQHDILLVCIGLAGLNRLPFCQF